MHYAAAGFFMRRTLVRGVGRETSQTTFKFVRIDPGSVEAFITSGGSSPADS